MGRYTLNKEAYFAVIKIKSKMVNGDTGGVVDCYKYNYMGPYDTPGPAKGQVTSYRKHYVDFVEGWVERASAWERLDPTS